MSGDEMRDARVSSVYETTSQKPRTPERNPPSGDGSYKGT